MRVSVFREAIQTHTLHIIIITNTTATATVVPVVVVAAERHVLICVML